MSQEMIVDDPIEEQMGAEELKSEQRDAEAATVWRQQCIEAGLTQRSRQSVYGYSIYPCHPISSLEVHEHSRLHHHQSHHHLLLQPWNQKLLCPSS